MLTSKIIGNKDIALSDVNLVNKADGHTYDYISFKDINKKHIHLWSYLTREQRDKEFESIQKQLTK